MNRARRALRHEKAKYARDVPELRDFLCDVPREIMDRLDGGQAGLLEIAQGFQLSYLLHEMGRHTTSRNCTVAAGLDDLMVPPYYVGNLVLNFRTYPIRIHDHVYEDMETRKPLSWQEVTAKGWVGGEKRTLTKELLASVGIDKIEGSSGPPYRDQHELTLEELNAEIGSTEMINELTSVTKLPRRFFTFSRQNLLDSIRHNRVNGEMYLSLNFADYADPMLAGVRGRGMEVVPSTSRLRPWLKRNLAGYLDRLRFIGTGPKTDDTIQLG
jgi:adenylosuccinate synthase